MDIQKNKYIEMCMKIYKDIKISIHILYIYIYIYIFVYIVKI